MYNFMVSSNPFKKACPKKVKGRKLLQRVIKVSNCSSLSLFIDSLFQNFFCNFFNGIEISIKFCIFDIHFEFMPKKKTLDHFSTFCKLSSQMPRKQFKKGKKTFFTHVSIVILYAHCTSIRVNRYIQIFCYIKFHFREYRPLVLFCCFEICVHFW